MFDLIALACGLVITVFAAAALVRHNDAFHPAVFTAPLMIGGYCLWPLVLNREGDLERLLGSTDIVKIQIYYLACLLVFFMAMATGKSSRALRERALSPWQRMLHTIDGRSARKKLMRLCIVLTVLSQLAYWYSISNVGGFDYAYSRYKGGGHAESGYIGEATLLAYPAVLIFALAKQGRGFRYSDALLILLIISPNLFQGTLGVRRGPLFISLATMFLSFVIIKGRAPGVIRTSIGLGLILLAVAFMWSQRTTWFQEDVGSNFTATGIERTLLPTSENLWENDYVSGLGSAIVTEYYSDFFWGKRWFVDLLVRPIPSQIWPTKYEDVGAYWKVGGNPTGFEELEYIKVLGFALPRGHSIGVLSDLYSEWYWFAVIVVFGLGKFLRWLWVKHRTVGQVWTAVFMAALGLCIYLPTQSFSAWYQRFLIMAVATYFTWRWVVGKDLRIDRDVAVGGQIRDPSRFPRRLGAAPRDVDRPR